MRKVCFILLLYLSLYYFFSVKIQPRVCSLSLSWTVVEYLSQSYWSNYTLGIVCEPPDYTPGYTLGAPRVCPTSPDYTPPDSVRGIVWKMK